MLNSDSTSTDDQRSLSESTHDLSTDPSDHLIDNVQLKSNSIQDGKVPKPDDERKLFVGQLSSDITKEDLNKYFSQFGTIEDVTIKYDVPGGRARGFAFILFDQKDSIDKVLRVPKHFLHQCQIDPKQAHRRPPVTNPVKKIFIGQLPTDFVENDLVDYFSQFGLVDTIELPMDRGKNTRRPFGFVSFSSEKTAEEVLRQQRHSINGISIEVRPAKPRPHEQQQQQQHQHQQPLHQQQYQNASSYSYGDYVLSPHTNSMIQHQNSFYPQIIHQQNYSGQIVDQWSQTGNNPLNPNWSNGNHQGLNPMNTNGNLYGSLGNSTSSPSSIYQHSHVYNPNGTNPQISYSLSNSHQANNHLYSSGYSLSTNDFQNPSAATASTPAWNQFNQLVNGTATTNQYDPNAYFASPYYPNIHSQTFYPMSQQQQQQYGMNSSQGNISVDGTTSTNVLTDKNYHQHATR